MINVTQDEVKKALASSTVETGNFSKELASAATTMKGFNALQTAYAQAMGGNFVGATKSATVAVKTLWGVMLANPFTFVIAAVAAPRRLGFQFPPRGVPVRYEQARG